MIYYDDISKRLLVFNEKNVSKDFWDKHWLKILNKEIKKFFTSKPKSLVCKITTKFLSNKEGPILEGGCGMGQHVYSLSKLNYEVIGVDNSKETIKIIQKEIPEINVQYGDVRELTYPNNYFAGYWSLGVIEHFFDGFSKIVLEMKRVIKPKGFLFLTFPYMSPFRKFKAKIHKYKILNRDFYSKFNKPKNFYQYIFEQEQILEIFERNGFKLKYSTTQGGLKGFKDEIFFLKFFLKKFFRLLYHTNKPKIILKLKRLIDKLLIKFAAHMIVLVFQKI